MTDIPMSWVVTSEGFPVGVFHEYADAERYRDRHGAPHWRINRAPYYG